ncbi:UDP-N-acetylmuramoyl-tripeptide--D-alanyl-D-alanine ligase [Postechiella marina]|uniref:UDP-N-acetylmuramoyl-tripeptide--D-alanyl-D-alanine ligase n=1 Tax=Postechiella marina TaxID=943941 RepID=A0ABP8CC43_9FLAO
MKIEQLHNLYLKCKTVCTDTRKLEKNDIFFALKGENFNGNTYAEKALKLGAKYVVIDDEAYNTSSQTILVSDVLKTLQELATYHRLHLNIPIIALTGSNGKTTTKELIKAVLSKKYNTTATLGNLNNHIGVPLTLLSMHNTTEIGIVEMGANHLKEIAFLCDIAKPDYGYITNFGKAHLEGFGSIEGVVKGKSEMYDYLITNKKKIFINANDSIQVEKTKNNKPISFGNTLNVNTYVSFKQAQPFVTSLYNNTEIKSQLIGDYNFNNIAAAICIGHYFKVEDKAIKNAIESYLPDNNRSQIITKGNNKIILDAYNANPTSMRAALLNFEKQKGLKIAVLGDMFEVGKKAMEEHQNIVDLANSLDINKTLFIGENFYKSDIDPLKSQKHLTFDSFKTHFKTLNLKETTLLIKGSRGMALERILELL